MNFDDLKLFIDVVQTQSFIRTAEKNHMSAPTLSRHIQRMEEELGAILLLRDNRSVSLTEAGERFLHFAEQGWANWQALQNQFSPQVELEGELRLFCSVTASYSHLPGILAKFRRRYPKIEIKLSTGDPAQALSYIQTMRADISLAGKPEPLPPTIAFHRIDDINLCLIVPRIACTATQLLQEETIDWQKMPFILPVDGPARKRIESWFKLQKIKSPQIYATVEGHEAIVPMIALGCGVALLPDVVVQHSPMRNQISHFELPLPISPFELGICVQQRRLKEPIIQAFWSILAEFC